MTARESRVLLVVAPYLSLKRPALGVGLLKAVLARGGIACDVRYLGFGYAEMVGIPFYEQIAGHVPTHDLVGDWIFADALHGEGATDSAGYEAAVLAEGPRYYDVATIEAIRAARRVSRLVVQRWADSIDLHAYDVVGFSSTFQQTMASLALARELKRQRPALNVVFGGANFEGPMGVEFHRCFDFIDVVVSGEADGSLPEIIRRIRAGRSLEGLPGVTYRVGPTSVTSRIPPVMITDLDAMPYPDHDEFVEGFRGSSAGQHMDPELAMETSRGCWWGQKHHCTFCGLNGNAMAYRGKSANRAFDEIRWLTGRYGIRRIFNTDNILNFEYFDSLFPRLIEAGIRLELHYETKANLKRWQLRMLRDLGASWFQPGIESLNSHVLSLMNKGVSGIQNVQLLRWARELGFRVTWNILCGFPGESPDDYDAQARIIRSIPHLQPPASFASFRLDRFSPMFDEPDRYGLANARPYASYGYCYPGLSDDSLRNIAYFYRYDPPVTPETARAIHKAWLATERWREEHRRGSLTAAVSPLFVLVQDTRAGRGPARHLLAGLDRHVYLAGFEVTTAAAIARSLPDGVAVEPDQIQSALDRFVTLDLMLAEGERYVSLALMPDLHSEQRDSVAFRKSLTTLETPAA